MNDDDAVVAHYSATNVLEVGKVMLKVLPHWLLHPATCMICVCILPTHCVLVRDMMSWMLQVGLGDFVEVYSGEKDIDGVDRPWIMEVTELFEDAQVPTTPPATTTFFGT